MKEVWKDIEDFKGYYQVSNLGRVRSLDRVVKGRVGNNVNKNSKIMATKIDTYGYVNVGFCKNNKKYTKRVHRLVAKAFIKNTQKKKTVNHINGVKDDNRLVNLEWNTQSENMKHSYKYLGRQSYKPYNNTHTRKACDMYNLKNDYIMTHKSIYHASLWLRNNTNYLKANDSHIVSVCKNNRKTAYGYKWKYKGD